MKRHQIITSVLESEPKPKRQIEQSSVDWWEENWATNVFTDEELAKRVSPEVFECFKQCVQTHTPLKPEIANIVASAMKGKRFC